MDINSPYFDGVFAALAITHPLPEQYVYTMVDRGNGLLFSVLERNHDCLTWLERADLSEFIAAIADNSGPMGIF